MDLATMDLAKTGLAAMGSALRWVWPQRNSTINHLGQELKIASRMGMGHDGFGSDRLGRDGFGSTTGSVAMGLAATGSAAADAAGGPSMQFLLQLVKVFLRGAC
jgi:hypothetical protein